MSAEAPPHKTKTTPKTPRLGHLLGRMLLRPRELLLLWNWKSAVLSVVLRGPIFFIAALQKGWQAAAAALFAESIFCALSAGFYGAVVQILKDAEPAWLTGTFLTVTLPVTFQALEYALHRYRGTPHLRVAAIVSFVMSGIATLFNWYAMRHGTMLVGREARGFSGDLRRLPRLILGFILALPRSIVGRLRSHSNA